MRVVSLVNLSTVVSPAGLVSAANAIQAQISLHLYPMWGTDAQVWYGTSLHPGSWPVYIYDTTDQAGDLGYHTLDGESVKGFVFAKTDEEAGVDWRTTLSHEVLEMLINPWVNDEIEFPYGGGIALTPKEVGDPTESATYTVKGVPVSNFVGPRWFVQGLQGGRFDWMGRINAPFTLDSGGYMSISTKIGEWTQIWGASADKENNREVRSNGYSRMARRSNKRGVK